MIEKKRIRIFLIIILAIPILCLIGFGTWIITNKLILKPNIEVDKVLTEYLNSQEGTYNGNVLLPNSDVLGIVNDGRNSELKYYYKEKDSSTNYIECVDSDKSIGPINAGEYLIKVTYKVNETTYESDELTFTINKATYDLSNITMSDTSKVYNREEQGIDIQGSLPKGVNVSYEGLGINVGTYTITAKFTGDSRNYEAIDDMAATLTITPKDISECRIYFSNIDITTDDNGFIFISERTLSYIQSGLTVKDSDEVLSINTEYNIDWNNCGVLPGSSNTAYVNGIGNYTGTNSITYTIEQPELIVSALSDTIDSATYDGTVKQPKVKVTTIYSSTPLTDYTLTYDIEPINAGTYNVKVTASKTGYTSGTSSVAFMIYPANINDAIVTVSSHSDNPNFFVYNNGNEIKPNVESVVLSDKTLQYGSEYTVSYSNNRNAGTNTAIAIVKGIGNYTGTVNGYFSIQKATPVITLPTFTKNNIIEGETPTIKSNGEAKHNNVKVSGTFTSSNINNILFTEGTSATSSFDVNYSFIPSDTSNYNRVENAGSITLTVYGVGYNSNTNTYYGTIEKGLSACTTNQTLWVVTKIYENTNFYPTIKKNCTVGSGITLALTMKDGDYTTGYKIYNDGEDATTTSSYPSGIGSCLAINQNITLTINGTLLVGGALISNSQVTARAVLMNNGTINFENGSTVRSYGYIKGNGIIYAKNGSTIYDAFRIYDFPGARYAAGMYYNTYKLSSQTYNNIMPFQSYSFHNISCPINLYYGSKYYARYQLNVSEQMYSQDLLMFGSGGLFSINTNGGTDLTKGYIKRTIENTVNTTNINGSYSTSNQSQYQRAVYEIYSDVSDNQIEVKMSLKDIIDINIKTSTDLAMPVGMMRFRITKGYSLSFSKNSYKFLPGTELVIDEGATMTLASGTNTIFYSEYYDNFKSFDNNGTETTPATFSYYNNHKSFYNSDHTVKSEYVSKIVVNGTLNANGGFGGILETTSSTGKVILQTSSATLNRLSSIRYWNVGASDILLAISTPISCGGTAYKDTQYSRMKMYNGYGVNIDYSSVAAGTYYSIKDDNDNYGWRTDKLNISYDLNGGNGTAPSPKLDISVSSNGYTVQESDIPTTTYTRDYYTFKGWALDGHGNEMVVANKTVLFASSVFYAIWEPINYSIQYKNVYYDNCGSGDNFDTNPNPDSYNVESIFNLSIPTNANYLFDGWFTDVSCSDEYRITSISNMHDNLVLYAHWFPEGTKTITIKFDIDMEEGVDTVLPHLTPEVVPIVNNSTSWQPTDLGSISNNNTSIAYYFDGWYFNDGTKYSSDELSNRLQNDSTITTITLYGHVKNKIKITYENVTGFEYTNKPDDYYVLPGASIKLPSGTAQTIYSSDNSTRTIYTFSSYSVTGMTGNIGLGSTITIGTSYSNNTVTIKPIITSKKQYQIVLEKTDNYSITVNSQKVNSGEYYDENSTISITVDAGANYWLYKYHYTVTITTNGTNIPSSVSSTNKNTGNATFKLTAKITLSSSKVNE